MTTQPGLPPVRYGFFGRLRAEFPSQFIVDVTEICNLACVHCYHPQFRKSGFYGAKSLDPELSRKLVDEVRAHGQGITQYIRFSASGEPLLNRELYGMLEYAARNSGVTVTLTINGTLMDQGHVERLLASGVDMIDISIDAFTPETYAKIRVNGDLRVTRANVLRLIEASRASARPVRVVVSYIEQPQNAHETADFEKFWKDHGAHYVVIRRLHSQAGTMGDIAGRMREGTTLARRPCLYPWERMVLNPRGFLAFCPVDWVHGSSIVDYRSTTILETWQGAFYRGLREAHLADDYTAYPFCGQCPDWQSVRWPDEGSSYADMIQDFKVRE